MDCSKAHYIADAYFLSYIYIPLVLYGSVAVANSIVVVVVVVVYRSSLEQLHGAE